jgi:hypothetical protein
MDEYKEKLLKEYESLNITTQELERIIGLIKDSNTLDFDTRAKTTAFLEGYMTGLKEQIEWLNRII